VCFHNEHVSFAATNPIENGGSEYLGPSLVSKSPEARKRNYPRNTEWEPQCCTLSGSERKPPYYILLLCVSVLFFFDLSIPSFCESVLLFALFEKVDVSEIVPRFIRVSRQHDKSDTEPSARGVPACRWYVWVPQNVTASTKTGPAQYVRPYIPRTKGSERRAGRAQN